MEQRIAVTSKKKGLVSIQLVTLLAKGSVTRMEESKELTIETERVDDLPVLFAQLKKMQVAELLDQHFPTHGNWQGLSLGSVVEGWLSHILSQGNHKLNHVEPWAEDHLTILQSYLDEKARALDWSDDHLARVLDYLGNDEGWDTFETDLGKHLIRVYDLDTKTIRLDSTASSSYAEANAGWLVAVRTESRTIDQTSPR